MAHPDRHRSLTLPDDLDPRLANAAQSVAGSHHGRPLDEVISVLRERMQQLAGPEVAATMDEHTLRTIAEQICDPVDVQ